MENTRNETISYTIERKFLARISVTEFVSRIIQSHIKSESIKRLPLNEKDIGKTLIYSKIYSREAVER